MLPTYYIDGKAPPPLRLNCEKVGKISPWGLEGPVGRRRDGKARRFLRSNLEKIPRISPPVRKVPAAPLAAHAARAASTESSERSARRSRSAHGRSPPPTDPPSGQHGRRRGSHALATPPNLTSGSEGASPNREISRSESEPASGKRPLRSPRGPKGQRFKKIVEETRVPEKVGNAPRQLGIRKKFQEAPKISNRSIQLSSATIKNS